MKQYETSRVTTQALGLAYMWSQLGTNPKKMNVLLLIEGDGFAEFGKWCGFGFKSFDIVCGLWRLFSFTSSAGSEPFCSWQLS